jgi:hypothetical protein
MGLIRNTICDWDLEMKSGTGLDGGYSISWTRYVMKGSFVWIVAQGDDPFEISDFGPEKLW